MEDTTDEFSLPNPERIGLPVYVCLVHGRVTHTIRFSLVSGDERYCGRCIWERYVSGQFAPLERVD